jgi:hypothetical protein
MLDLIMALIVLRARILHPKDGSNTEREHLIAIVERVKIQNLKNFRILNHFCGFILDMVKISMETFVRRFQPEKYQNWIEGNDWGEHPEEPGKITLAPKPVLNKKLMM